MKILSERIDVQTGKRQFLAFIPRKDVQDEHTQQIAFDTLARQFGLSLDEKDDEIVYLNEETQRCWYFQQDGAWNGALSEIEMGFSTRSEEVQKRIIQQCFKQCAKLSGKSLKQKTNGRFTDNDVQRWYVFFEQAFRLAVSYQGEYRDAMWFNFDDFEL